MRQFKHVATGELMSVYDGQSVLSVLEESPSWEELVSEAPEAPEKSSKKASATKVE